MSHAAYRPYRLKRQRLLISCATLAITVALTPQRAWAQAFQGTPSTVSGTVAYNRSTPGSETVTIGSGTATINWAPNDAQGTGHIDFLPNGSSATYQGASGLSDFTVLNRIVPTDATRTIELNGTVLSKLDGGATGGNIWFYSPGGILIGSNAVIDVGGLLLSTVDLPNGFTTSTTGFFANFSKTQDLAGSIQILSGAQINARSSYVALIAPRIEQGGNVQVNGSAAYVAAEQGTLTLNQGWFDISVPFGGGTSDANGIVHTGTTGGTANATATDNHNIYIAAIPKNQALIMLLDGSIGFAPPATGATVENGQIYLTSAFGTTGGQTGLTIGSQAGANFTSTVTADMDGPIAVVATNADVNFSGDVYLYDDLSTGSGSVSLLASNGHNITVGSDMFLASGDATDISALMLSLPWRSAVRPLA